jgi:hypothetical protein
VSVLEGFEVELPYGRCTRKANPPQGCCRHVLSIGATAPKLRAAPHTREATQEVG